MHGCGAGGKIGERGERRNKSLFASFSSEKKICSFLKKRTKKLLRLAPHRLKISSSGKIFVESTG
jgi:hypothetical protein